MPYSLRYFLLPLAGALVLFVATVLLLRAEQREAIRARRVIPSPPGIESLETVQLGGIEQWISVRGRDRDNPVLLFLHGGPGGPSMPSSHLYQDLWEDELTVVQWDQRGAGKTHHTNGRGIASTLTVDRVVEDGLELVQHLRRRFSQEKIVLVGHSWGSYIGMRLVLEHPELFHAYVGVGQLVNMRENFRVSYEETLAMARAHDDTRAVARLERMGPPPYAPEEERRKIGHVQSYVLRYGGSIHGLGGLWDLLAAYWRLYFVAPEYTLEDVYYGFDGARFSYDVLYREFMELDLTAFGREVDVPVFFFLGRHDYQTPSRLAADYLQSLRAPRKELVWFEWSAHGPMVEQPEVFAEELLLRLRPLLSQWPRAVG